jgi:hypothetical protein
MDSVQKLRALAKLLPYRLTVAYKEKEYILAALDVTQGNNCTIIQEDEGRILNKIKVAVTEIKPFLYGEDSLYKFIGEQVPAYEIARLAINDLDNDFRYSLAVIEGYVESVVCKSSSSDDIYKVYIHENYDIGVDMIFPGEKDMSASIYNMSKIYDYLASMHFAVDWDPKEYIEKKV